MSKKILILMAVFNGEKFIEEQLESLLNQTYKNWDLLISDDNSQDKTLEILDKYLKTTPNIKLIKNKFENSAIGNFGNLIKEAQGMEYDYFMFCDQDDFWLEDKIEKTLNAILKMDDNECNLVFTGKQYVDIKLNKIKYNLNKYYKDYTLKRLLHQNIIYGCTMMFNKKLLLNLDHNIPTEFVNHDHYVAIMAKILGKIYYLDYKSILYRQHGSNTSGSVNKTIFQKLANKKAVIQNIKTFIFISEFLNKNYKNYLKDNEQKEINEIAQNMPKGGFKSSYILIKNRITKIHFMSTLRFYYEIFRI